MVILAQFTNVTTNHVLLITNNTIPELDGITNLDFVV